MFQLSSFQIHNDIISFLPELYLITSINIILVYSVVYSTSPFFDYPLLLNNNSWLCILILFFTLLLNLANTSYNIILFNDLIILDPFNIAVKFVILFLSIFILIMSLRYNHLELLNNPEFPVILLLSVLGTLLLVSSYDLLVLYLAIELQSFCSYILTSFKRNSEFSTEAGLKYFILGAFSSSFLLFGCSLVYGFTGTTNYSLLSLLVLNCNSIFSSGNGIVIGCSFIFISFLFKLSAAPFHVWSPDIYEGAPIVVTTFFIVIQKLGLLTFFLRLFFGSFYSVFKFWQPLLAIVCLISMIVGSFGALWQTKFKRLLAFSSIGHIGYILVALCCSSFESIYALVFYSFVYSVTNVSSFIILLILRKSSDNKRIKYIEDLVIVAKTNPLLGIFLVITFFSIAGVPPLAGFFSKMFVFLNSVGQDIFSLAVIGMLSSVVSCFYYLKIVQTSFFERIGNFFTMKKIGKELSFLISIVNIFLVIFFIHPSLFSVLMHLVIYDLFF
jgi:NADH-quinone oxidoreductase subunit N